MEPALTEQPTERRKHLLIAGTGRAGTSFIVRYLTALGLDTTLSRQGDAAFWDENANAGLEEVPNLDTAAWPYVVKTPWLYQFVDQLLANGSVDIDAVVIPVRSLREAAASRVILELRALHAEHSWVAEDDQPRTEWGLTAGGCFLSLEPLDQARMLAVGFHHLVERLVRADVPIVLLAFPRLASDPDYLFARLAPHLPGVDAATAGQVHARLAEPAKVRVGDELQSVAIRREGDVVEREAGLATLDNIALRRELVRVRGELAAVAARESDALAEASQVREQIDDLQRRYEAFITTERDLERAAAERAEAEARASRAVGEADLAQQQVQDLRRRNEALTGEVGRLGAKVHELRADLAAIVDERATQLELLRAEIQRLESERQTILSSTSWRITRPLRGLATALPIGGRMRLRQAIGLVTRYRPTRS